MEVADSVACYSGHAYATEPRAIVWHGMRHAVEVVLARWRTPAGPAFRVRTDGGEVFHLQYDMERDRWQIELMTGQGGPDQP